jgi:hypothetical protein
VKEGITLLNFYGALTFYSLLVARCTNIAPIQELFALPTLYLCVLYLPENKQRLVSHHKQVGFYNRVEKCLQRGTNWASK